MDPFQYFAVDLKAAGPYYSIERSVIVLLTHGHMGKEQTSLTRKALVCAFFFLGGGGGGFHIDRLLTGDISVIDECKDVEEGFAHQLLDIEKWCSEDEKQER